MSKKITIEIPSPPDGMEASKKKDRSPKEGEEYWFFYRHVWKWIGPFYTLDGLVDETCVAYAYRIRDEYAERYEALKLPDGWAWTPLKTDMILWACDAYYGPNDDKEFNPSLRRIVNGKAIRP